MTEAIIPVTPEPEEAWDIAHFNHYVRCLCGNASYQDKNGVWNQLYEGWFHNMATMHQVHVSVRAMLQKYRPADYKKLALEYPYVSTTDEMRIAYTRTKADGEAGRQLVTSIGKYLARHWPHVPDHLRRDAQALYTVDERMIVTSREDILIAIETGPRSCMTSQHGSIPWRPDDTTNLQLWMAGGEVEEPDWEKHPYTSYAPELGWSMAQRWSSSGGEGRRLDGRALLYSGPAKPGGDHIKGVFVRTYARHKTEPVHGQSETDFALHTWLESQGYLKFDSWPRGAKLRTSVLNRNWEGKDSASIITLPYVDGSGAILSLDEEDDNASFRTATFVISDDRDHGLFSARSTSGRSVIIDVCDDDDDGEDYFSCENCDTRTHDENGVWASWGEDIHVCEHCAESDFTYVRGERHTYQSVSVRYAEYHVHNDSCEQVCRPGRQRNYYIDSEYPPEGVVQLENGNWADEEDVISIDDEYYIADEVEYVTLEDGEYAFLENACQIDDEWFLRDACFESEVQIGHWFKEEYERDDFDIEAAKPEPDGQTELNFTLVAETT